MKFTHTCDDRLSGILVRICLERRVFFCQFCQSNTHFFLSSLCFWLDSDLDNRIREFHGFQNDLMFFVTQSITSCRHFQTYCSSDITGVYLFDILSLVRMHLQDTSHSFFLALSRVVNIGPGVQRSGVNPEECQFTNIRVSHDLKCQSGERTIVICRSFFFLFRIRNNALDRRNIKRRRHIVDNSVQHQLYTLVSICRTACYRNHFSCNRCGTNNLFDLSLSDLFSFQELHHQFFICFCNRLQKFFSPLIS